MASAANGFQLYFGFSIEAIASTRGDFEYSYLLLGLFQEGGAALLLSLVEEQSSDYGFGWGQPAA